MDQLVVRTIKRVRERKKKGNARRKLGSYWREYPHRAVDESELGGPTALAAFNIKMQPERCCWLPAEGVATATTKKKEPCEQAPRMGYSLFPVPASESIIQCTTTLQHCILPLL